MLYLLNNLNLNPLHLAPISLSLGSLAPCFPITKHSAHFFISLNYSFKR